MTTSLLLLPVLLISASAGAAEMYKCVEGGKTTFSDRPCAGAAEKINVVPNRIGTGETLEDVRAKIADREARAQAARAAQAKADAEAAEIQRRDAADNRQLAETIAIREALEKQNNAPLGGFAPIYPYNPYSPYAAAPPPQKVQVEVVVKNAPAAATPSPAAATAPSKAAAKKTTK